MSDARASRSWGSHHGASGPCLWRHPIPPQSWAGSGMEAKGSQCFRCPVARRCRQTWCPDFPWPSRPSIQPWGLAHTTHSQLTPAITAVAAIGLPVINFLPYKEQDLSFNIADVYAAHSRLFVHTVWWKRQQGISTNNCFNYIVLIWGLANCTWIVLNTTVSYFSIESYYSPKYAFYNSPPHSKSNPITSCYK